MSIIEWHESMSVNIDEIDRQHQNLVLTIQKLEDSIKQGRSRDVLQEILNELTQYLDVHFKAEERIFKIINYPDAESHRKEHTDFVRRVTQFKREYENGSVGLTAEIMNFLCDWARNHIKKEDKKYGDFIAAQRRTP